MEKITKPLLRGHFHQAMFFVSLGACILLIAKSDSNITLIASVVYSTSVLLMFGISALYHRITWDMKKRAFMKKLDHTAIYIMIAGTFTPISLIALSKESGSGLILIIWIVAAIGIIQSMFFVNLPKIISAGIYLVMGYLILPYLSELLPSLGMTNIILLVAGGVAYSMGALAYGLKRPVLAPEYFGYHEVFHIFVSIGAILHFIIVYSLI